MNAAEVAGLAMIRAAYGEPVLYTGAGLDDASVIAIYSNGAGPAFQGPGNTVREISFEIERAALPERPRIGNTIDRGGIVWRVSQVTERDDIDAWVLVVER